MLVAVLNTCSKEELDHDQVPEPHHDDPVRDRRAVIKNKILAVGRMARVFAVLREESENISELKSITSTGRLPYGTLALGAEGIKQAISTFEDARRSDIENERLPPPAAEKSALLGQSKNHLQSLAPSSTTLPPFIPMLTPSRPMTPSDDGRETPSLERASSPSASSISSPPTPPPPPANSDRKGALRLGGSPSTRQRSVHSAISILHAALDGKKGGAS